MTSARAYSSSSTPIPEVVGGCLQGGLSEVPQFEIGLDRRILDECVGLDAAEKNQRGANRGA